METILLKILEVQNEILAEMRLLRQALAPTQLPASQASPRIEATPPPRTTPPAPSAAPVATPVTAPAPTPPAAPREHPGTMLTVNELTNLGEQFLDPGQLPRSRVKPVDASALSHSILDDIKAKNKAKSIAFSEFEKFGRDR